MLPKAKVILDFILSISTTLKLDTIASLIHKEDHLINWCDQICKSVRLRITILIDRDLLFVVDRADARSLGGKFSSLNEQIIKRIRNSRDVE